MTIDFSYFPRLLSAAISFAGLLLCTVPAIGQQNTIGWIGTDTRCKIGDSIRIVTSSTAIKAWKGEETYAQAAIYGNSDIDSLRIVTNELKCGSNTIPLSAIKVGYVGYVMTDELNKDRRGACGYRDKRDFDSSYVADPIDYQAIVRKVKKHTIQPVWIKINVPRTTPEGLYTGKLAACNGSDTLQILKLELYVSAREMPVENDFHLDLWQNPFAVSRYYGVEPFSKEHFELMRPIMKEYAEAGGKVITASIMHKPWNGQTYDPFESMVTWLKKADGTWWFDYTVFDKWVEFMMSLGVKQQINCYSMVPWALSFQYIDQASNSFRFFNAEPGQPEYEKFWSVMLKSFASHLKEKGWFDITMIAMDERPMKHMKAAIEVIKNADPEFKISFAGNFHEELLEQIDDYCIPIGAGYPDGAAAVRRKEGKVTTVYTSCAEAWPNTFTFSSPAEAEWIGWSAAAQEVDGYLRWAFNSWPESPLSDSRFTTWAAGDTYLIYPDAVSSIRFERLKAGITAYRKINVLRREFISEGNKRKLAKLEKALETFTVPDKETVVKIVTDEKEDYAADAVNKARSILDKL